MNARAMVRGYSRPRGDESALTTSLQDGEGRHMPALSSRLACEAYGLSFATRVLQFARLDRLPEQVKFVAMYCCSVHGPCSMYSPAT